MATSTPDPTVDHTGRKLPQYQYEEEEEAAEPPTELMKHHLHTVGLATGARHHSLMLNTAKRHSKRHRHFASLLAAMGTLAPGAPTSDKEDVDKAGEEISEDLRRATLAMGGPRQRPRANSNPIRDRLSLLFNTELGERAPLLPARAKGKPHAITLVLDMDETLIHSEGVPLIPGSKPPTDEEYENDGVRPPDFHVDVPEFNQRFGVYKRPFVEQFLKEVSQDFEVVVFTAGCQEYASRLLDKLDPQGYIHHRLYRQHTVTVGEQNYVKDMTGLDRDIRRIVLVDNSWYVMEATPDNCIPIKDFYGDLEDRELPRLLSVCVSLKDEKDVRVYLRRTFNVTGSLQSLRGN